jgi:hypothetical protein
MTTRNACGTYLLYRKGIEQESEKEQGLQRPCFVYLKWNSATGAIGKIVICIIILDEVRTDGLTSFRFTVKSSVINVVGCILLGKIGTPPFYKGSQRYFQHFSMCLSGSFFEHRLTTIARRNEMGRAINWASITVQGKLARVDFPKRYWAMPTA